MKIYNQYINDDSYIDMICMGKLNSMGPGCIHGVLQNAIPRYSISL